MQQHRSKHWQKEARCEEKQRKRRDWYNQRGFESVMFVDATPDRELMWNFETIIREVELPVRVVERSGNSVKEMVVRSNPFKRAKCRCNVCQLGENGNVNCKSRELVYELTCNGMDDGKLCDQKYIGETSRSLAERISEHIGDLRERTEKSVLWRHFKEEHGEEEDPC